MKSFSKLITCIINFEAQKKDFMKKLNNFIIDIEKKDTIKDANSILDSLVDSLVELQLSRQDLNCLSNQLDKILSSSELFDSKGLEAYVLTNLFGAIMYYLNNKFSCHVDKAIIWLETIVNMDLLLEYPKGEDKVGALICLSENCDDLFQALEEINSDYKKRPFNERTHEVHKEVVNALLHQVELFYYPDQEDILLTTIQAPDTEDKGNKAPSIDLSIFSTNRETQPKASSPFDYSKWGKRILLGFVNVLLVLPLCIPLCMKYLCTKSGFFSMNDEAEDRKKDADYVLEEFRNHLSPAWS